MTPREEKSSDSARSRGVEPEKVAKPRRSGLWREIVIGLAAVLAIAAALEFSKRSRSKDEMPAVERIVAVLPAGATAAPEWRTRPWTEFRGSGQPISKRGRAIRVGALITELEAFALSDDSTAAKIAAQVSALLDEYPAGGAVGHVYRVLADSQTYRDRTKRMEAARAAETLAGPTDVRLGAWLEAGRIAAARNDTAFFSRPDTWSSLWVARTAAAEDANTRASVTVLSAYIAEPPRDSRRIAIALDALLRALAN